MYDLMSNILFVGKSNMQTFQKSVLMQISSLKMLFLDMKWKHDVRYIATYKLNQDVLENFFSHIRQMDGAQDHPSPLTCIYRIKMIILGKTTTILKN
uniref:Transposable element P transposase-like RNase H C-terminal domain-containing protein n=1 Tax=Anopheles epiroticus TaxID=199890 RepID=A0A182PX91_9DIPT